MKDWNSADPKAIGVDEATAVCIDTAGKAIVFGSSSAHFFKPYCGAPERCVSGSSLNWTKGVKDYKVQGTTAGTNWFNVANWITGSGGVWEYWTVNNGTFAVQSSAPAGCGITSIAKPLALEISKPQGRRGLVVSTHGGAFLGKQVFNCRGQSPSVSNAKGVVILK